MNEVMANHHTNKRTALPKKTRQYCGAHPPSVLLHVDHVLAVASGGVNSFDNLVTACEACNLGKGARSLSTAPQSLSDKAKETQEREAQIEGFHAIFEAKRLRQESETWRVMGVLYGRELQKCNSADFSSAKMFIERLGLYAALEAADIANAANISTSTRFRYFCGVCWNRLRKELE